MSPTTIRTAREVDVAAIAELVRDAFAVYADRMDALPAPVTADWSTVVSALGARIATQDGGVVGVLVVWPHPDHLLLETLAVSPAHQGAGIGALLLAAAEHEATALGLPAVRLYTNAAMTENLAWYPRHGYVRVARRVEQGYDRVFFEKRLV